MPVIAELEFREELDAQRSRQSLYMEALGYPPIEILLLPDRLPWRARTAHYRYRLACLVATALRAERRPW